MTTFRRRADVDPTPSARRVRSAEGLREGERTSNVMDSATSRSFERHCRDAHLLLQHASTSRARDRSAGRCMCSRANDWGWLRVSDESRATSCASRARHEHDSTQPPATT
jgi:hypothetical protein